MSDTTQIKEKIDFKSISKETGVEKGRIYKSQTFKSWVIEGHADIDLICINPPHNIGDELNGKIIESVQIDNKYWVFNCS